MFSRYKITNLDAPWEWKIYVHEKHKFKPFMHRLNIPYMEPMGSLYKYNQTMQIFELLLMCVCVCACALYIYRVCTYIWCVSIFTAMVNTSWGRRRYDAPKKSKWPDSDGSHPPWNCPSKLGETSTGNPNALHSQIPIQQGSNATMYNLNILVYWQVGLIDVLRIFLKSRPLRFFMIFRVPTPSEKNTNGSV